MSLSHVLVFDSGVGGLSICQQIIATSVPIKLTYLSDNAGFPYGEKQAAEVIQRASEVIYKAYLRFRPDIVVIACNTASTVVLPTLRAQLPIPVVGVVPAIKTAAQQSLTKTFGLLATPATVSRVYTAQLIAEHANDCSVISVGSSELVIETEQLLYGKPLDLNVLKNIICQFEQHPKAASIDTIILGCTHFPLVKAQLQTLRSDWQWIDSGTAISARVASLLGHTLPSHAPSAFNNNAVKSESHSIWFTLKDNNNVGLHSVLKSMGFSDPQHLD